MSNLVQMPLLDNPANRSSALPAAPRMRAFAVPKGVHVVAYGGGVNTIAALVMLRRLNVRPKAIVMADPGKEWRSAIAYRDDVAGPWRRKVGFPDITVISRAAEGALRPRAWRLETLAEECDRIESIPSAAFGFKKCSDKYKAQPQRWWLARQRWAIDEWDAGRKLIKTIGYDADEQRRIRDVFGDEWEAKRSVPFYPLFIAGIGYEECKELIRSEGLPVPPGSACTYCPNNKLSDWERLRTEEPDSFADAVAMSRRAASTITDPDVVGLMRCNLHGKRQLHVWTDGGYQIQAARSDDSGDRETMPCECAL